METREVKKLIEDGYGWNNFLDLVAKEFNATIQDVVDFKKATGLVYSPVTVVKDEVDPDDEDSSEEEYDDSSEYGCGPSGSYTIVFELNEWVDKALHMHLKHYAVYAYKEPGGNLEMQDAVFEEVEKVAKVITEWKKKVR